MLERRPFVGGAAVTEELWPGYRLSTASYTQALLQPKVILDLELKRHGYEVLKPPPMFMPLAGGKSLVFHDDLARTQANIAQFSRRDAEAYPRYRQFMQSLGAAIQPLLYEIAPDPGSRKLGDLLRLARLAWRQRGLGDRVYDVYDVMTLSAFDFLARWFESDEMRASLGFYASGGGANSGIKSPGSALRPDARLHPRQHDGRRRRRLHPRRHGFDLQRDRRVGHRGRHDRPHRCRGGPGRGRGRPRGRCRAGIGRAHRGESA